jgi:aldehyde dehydrogenase (NAD+)
MDIENMINQQRTFFKSDQTKSVAYRLIQLKKLKRILKENENLLFEAIAMDFGKSSFDTYMTELSLIYSELNWLIKNSKKLSAKKKVRTNLANFPAKSYIIPEPLGVCLVIGAWNYPFQLSLLPAITALAAGNTVVLKPSELPVNTSSIMTKLINQNFPKELFFVQEGDVAVTTELLNHRFDKIFFTGSIPIGKIVYQAAAKHLTPITLELGGKSPAIVLSDCDISMTVKRLVWAKFLNAGQTCVAPDYILVDQTISSKFIEALINEVKKHYNDEVRTENYVKIINLKNFKRLINLISIDKLIFGGKYNQDELFISPTLLFPINFNDKVMQDEIFGPILPILPFENLSSTLSTLKDLPKPLSAYVFSNDKKIIDNILNQLSFGNGAINDAVTQLSNHNLPFGGVGTSGMGSYHGKAGFDGFTHYKSILAKSNWMELPIKYSPYSNFKLNLIKKLLG